MTRADKIKAYVKERYGVELNDQIIDETEFTFRGCDGFECPEECRHEEEAPDCDKCKYYEFWDQEDINEDFNHEKFYNFLINTIQPNEMEKYRNMFLSSGEIVN